MSTKLCKKCNEIKDVNEFTTHTKAYDGLYYCCRKCKSIGRKKEKYCPEKSKARYQRFKKEHPDYFRIKTREWASANPDKIKAGKRRYIESGMNRIHTQQRRARLLSLPHTFNKNDWTNALEHFNYSCAYCHDSERDLQMEHFIPLSKNGHFTTYNIIPACDKCNFSKQDADYFEWYPRQGHFSADKLEYILAWLDYHVLRNDVKLSDKYATANHGGITI